MIFSELNSLIQTISGIGEINGFMILLEIGNIFSFSKPNQLIAFAGFDPTTNKSDNFKTKSTQMTKRGSGVLLHALINAAWNVSLNNISNFITMENFPLSGSYAALGHVSSKLTGFILKSSKIIFFLIYFNSLL